MWTKYIKPRPLVLLPFQSMAINQEGLYEFILKSRLFHTMETEDKTGDTCKFQSSNGFPPVMVP